MAKNSVKVFREECGYGWISRKKATELVNRGLARWNGDVCHCISSTSRAPSISVPTIVYAPVAEVLDEPVEIHDSNLAQTFLRYPHASQATQRCA